MVKLIGGRGIAALGMTILLLSAASSATASNLSERTKQKRAAESEHADLKRKLDAIKRGISRTETAKDRAADALAHSEQVISETNRSLFELVQEQQQTQAKLNQLSEQQVKLHQTVELQKKYLAKVVREQYVTGNEDRTKLLLSGDNPNRLNRELRYMGYVSQAQAKLIDGLRANLQGIETNKAETQSVKDELDEIAQETRDQKALLEKEKAQHATLLAQLSSKLAAQRTQAGNIQRDEQRLAALVSKLDQLIEEQRKADLAAAEKRREKEIARAKQQAKMAKNRSKGNAAKGKITNPDAIDDDVAPKSMGRNELTPEASVENNVFLKDFSSLRGQLHLPLRGDLMAKFGAKRNDGPSWKGLFIRAPEGTNVKAIAPGRVIFADWLRGFGNLIIIDHGSQYMTIYGNNQAVLKHTGDPVKTGDIIASAGNSGGNEQSGLYFEMRYKGRAFDPLEWVTIR